VKVDFDDIFVQPDALRHGDIGRYLAVPVRRVFGFVFAYTQVTHLSFTGSLDFYRAASNADAVL